MARKNNNGPAPIETPMKDPKERLKAVTDKLEQGVKDLMTSGRFGDYLDTLSKFHRYSMRNAMLIAMQMPDATRVAGFGAWRDKFGRNVMKGEKGIKILAPTPFKITEEREIINPKTGKPVTGRDGKPKTEMAEVEIPYYKVVSVFDVSQTEGKELPEIAAQLTDGVEGYKEMMDALKKSSPTPISFENFEKIRSTANGYYDHAEKRIAVKAGMGEAQTVKTMIHEIAHAKLHDIDLVKPKDGQVQKNTETREVEAEAVAYTVCQRYGIDTSDYSFGYIAGWSSGKELPELNASLETIRDAAGALISDIDKHLGIEKPRENYSTRTDGGRMGGDATHGKAGREERRKPSVKEKLRRGTDKGQYRKPGRAVRTPKPKGKELPGAGGR